MPDVPAHTTATLIEAIDANISRARSLAGGLSRQQFNWPPAAGVWSIGQNLGHLIILDGDASLEAIRASIAQGRAAGFTASGPFRCGSISAKLVASQAPPVTKKYKATKNLHATADLEPDPTLSHYIRVSNDLRALVKSAAGLDLARIRTTLPALPPLLRPFLKMSLVARIALVTTHDSRHLWQIEQIRKMADFPKSQAGETRHT